MKTTILLFFLQVAFALSITGAEPENVYTNPTVGISVTKPSEWHFSTVEQNIENLKRTQLKDEDFQKLMVKYATAPLVVMMKYTEPYDDLNPSFKVNIKPLGGLPADDPKAIISLILPQLEKVFKDYQLVEEPNDVEVAGLKAAYTKIHYSLQIPDGREFPTCSEIWVVPRGSFFFLIGAGTRQDEKTGKREIIRGILKSLVIDKTAKAE